MYQYVLKADLILILKIGLLLRKIKKCEIFKFQAALVFMFHGYAVKLFLEWPDRSTTLNKVSYLNVDMETKGH